MLEERAIPGLHEFILEYAIRNVKTQGRVLDLGAWSGAMAERLKNAGFQMVAADVQKEAFKAPVEFVQVDLNEPDFHKRLSAEFDFITCIIEVIEHLESPIGLLKNIRSLLKTGGACLDHHPQSAERSDSAKISDRGHYPNHGCEICRAYHPDLLRSIRAAIFAKGPPSSCGAHRIPRRRLSLNCPAIFYSNLQAPRQALEGTSLERRQQHFRIEARSITRIPS